MAGPVKHQAPPPPPTKGGAGTPPPESAVKVAVKKEIGDAPPNLANATDGYLVDQVGELRELKKRFEKWLGYFEEALKARFEAQKKVSLEGEGFAAQYGSVTQFRLSQELLIEKFGQAAIEECKAETSFKQLKFAKK